MIIYAACGLLLEKNMNNRWTLPLLAALFLSVFAPHTAHSMVHAVKITAMHLLKKRTTQAALAALVAGKMSLHCTKLARDLDATEANQDLKARYEGFAKGFEMAAYMAGTSWFFAFSLPADKN